MLVPIDTSLTASQNSTDIAMRLEMAPERRRILLEGRGQAERHGTCGFRGLQQTLQRKRDHEKAGAFGGSVKGCKGLRRVRHTALESLKSLSSISYFKNTTITSWLKNQHL